MASNRVAPAAPAAMATKAARSDVRGARPAPLPARKSPTLCHSKKRQKTTERLAATGNGEPPAPALRSNFSETAFWQPHLLTGRRRLGHDRVHGAGFRHVVERLGPRRHEGSPRRLGGRKRRGRVKDLMVRPYVPRFLREGDKAEIKVVVNNASEKTALRARSTLDILDPDRNTSLNTAFGVGDADARKPFTVKPGGGTNLTFLVTAPTGLRNVAFKVTATAGDVSDGELRPVPVLPGRMHLVQSRFVTLRNKDRKTLRFDDLAKNDDPTLVNEQMVVTVDAQLFYTVLQALPYLVNYPYECTEQTLNRFVSTGIVSSVYKDYPAVAKMAAEMSKRTTPLESWDAPDPNRKMALEETPWLVTARGGRTRTSTRSTSSTRASRRRTASRRSRKLRKAQTSVGGFPWFPGGPPSPYMTLYILHGFAKAVGVRRRRAEGHDPARLRVRRRALPHGVEALHVAERLLGVRHVPELRRLGVSRRVLDERRHHGGRAPGDARLLASSTGSSTRRI